MIENCFTKIANRQNLIGYTFGMSHIDHMDASSYYIPDIPLLIQQTTQTLTTGY